MPVIGEFRLFAFDTVPDGWLPCNGQTLEMTAYPDLGAVLGQTYGGNAASGTFNLPDLRSRVMMGTGSADWGVPKPVGTMGGTEGVALTADQIPAHPHSLNVSVNAHGPVTAGVTIAQNMMDGQLPGEASFNAGIAPVQLNAATVGNTGQSTAHENRMPSLSLAFGIATQTSGQSPILGEVRHFAGYRAPSGWQFCDGSLLSASENPVLFSVMGTAFGGDGITTFGIPDLRGRACIMAGQGNGLTNYTFAQQVGQETVILTPDELPPHSHSIMADSCEADMNDASGNLFAGRVLSTSGTVLSYLPYGTNTAMVALAPGTIGPNPGGQGHENRQPYLPISFIICTSGATPTW